MAESSKRLNFRIHALVPYNRTTGVPYGNFKVLGSGSMNSTFESVSLMGGSQRGAWGVEVTTANHDFTCGIKEWPDALYQIFLGIAPTATAASLTGSVQNFANKSGTSIFDASTGIATATSKSGAEADLKASSYVVKYVSATTVDVYMMSDVQKKKGTDITLQDDLQKITVTPLTITASTATEIPGTGVELTGGSGIIALTATDTATFDTYPIHSGVSEVVIGSSAENFIEFGCWVIAQETASNAIFMIDIYKGFATSGANLAFGEKEYAETDIVIKALYDQVKDGVYKVYHIDSTT